MAAVCNKQVRYSRQRELILNYLLNTKEHPSADMIYNDLLPQCKDLSLGTVYRNLKHLIEQGSVRSVGVFDGKERYDAHTDTHMHFRCKKCLNIFDLDYLDEESIKKSINLKKGFNLEKLELLIHGNCPNCIDKIKHK